jgi:hypothetical protein
VHGKANVLQRAGEFPAPLAHDFPISDDAARYYKSGKSFLYRTMPFWIASLADRLLVVLVPIIVVLIPGLRLVPSLYAWRVRSRIYRWYGALIAIERGSLSETSQDERDALIERLDAIEESVNGLKMPLAYADQFYVLREHIGFVRERLTRPRDPHVDAHALGLAGRHDEAAHETWQDSGRDADAAAEADAVAQAAHADTAARTDAAARTAAQGAPVDEMEPHGHEGSRTAPETGRTGPPHTA